MTANEDDHRAREADAFGKFFTFRGTVGRGWYLAGLGGEFAILLVGMIALAGLNNPTGGGNIFIAMIFPLLAVLLHIFLVVARVRDAGAAYPVPLGIVIAALPFGITYLLIEYIEYLWVLMLIGFFVPWLGPVFAKSKAAGAPQS